jgi:hypothetical protein|tara:strand:+ start:716 stop:1018 length:303 start_codon:yes stop_codon:yes gene_type:complete
MKRYEGPEKKGSEGVVKFIAEIDDARTDEYQRPEEYPEDRGRWYPVDTPEDREDRVSIRCVGVLVTVDPTDTVRDMMLQIQKETGVAVDTAFRHVGRGAK